MFSKGTVLDDCVWMYLLSWFDSLQGLLQSEVEGVDNENVGFYGRCMLHAAHPCELDSDPIDLETDSSGEKELTCARTEVFIFIFLLTLCYFTWCAETLEL